MLSSLQMRRTEAETQMHETKLAGFNGAICSTDAKHVGMSRECSFGSKAADAVSDLHHDGESSAAGGRSSLRLVNSPHDGMTRLSYCLTNLRHVYMRVTCFLKLNLTY
jgi:hypothetical protein